MGLAKSTDSGGSVTLFGTVLGTPHYMSPEQSQGEEKLDMRSDMFSLGATWYHMLTNCIPFEGPDPFAIMQAVINQETVPLYERNPRISDSTCAVVAKMMEKNRDKRYQNFTELLEELYHLKRGEPTISEQTGYAPKGRQSLVNKFRESFVPSDEDVWLGKIALHNKLATPEKLEESFNRQEILWFLGICMDLGDVLLDKKIISPQQKGFLDQFKIQYILDRADETFLKACTAHNLLNQVEINECQRLKKNQQKGIGAYLLAQGTIEEERCQKIYSAMRHAMNVEESKLIIKASMDSSLISQAQAEKCSRIYSNNIVMGKYRDIGSILLEKGFLVPEAYQAVLRAVRRSILTGFPTTRYINEKWIQ
jgi:serine/threonine protein kinase